jgi:hypothetical protein
MVETGKIPPTAHKAVVENVKVVAPTHVLPVTSVVPTTPVVHVTHVVEAKPTPIKVGLVTPVVVEEITTKQIAEITVALKESGADSHSQMITLAKILKILRER